MMPFDFRMFFRMFSLSFRDDLSPRRRKFVAVLLLAMPLLAAFNAICFALDHVLFPGFHRVGIREPIFIVGHSRSGTSLLHRLMCADSERFSWFMMYEMLLPSLVQRKFVRFLGRLDQRFLGGAVDARIQAWEDRVFAKGRQMHPMSLTGPEEDEFLMGPTFCSGTVAMIFPYLREILPYSHFDSLPARRRRRVMRYYRQCVRRQLYLNGSHKIHLSKNPMFSEKIASLIQIFPDARFVVTVRHPYETIPSIQKMMLRNWKASGCNDERIRDSLQVLAETSFSAYMHPFEILDAAPEMRHTVVRYEDLLERPKETAEAVFSALDIPVSASVTESLEREQANAQSYTPRHSYSLDEFGISKDEIRRRLASLFERFAWAA